MTDKPTSGRAEVPSDKDHTLVARPEDDGVTAIFGAGLQDLPDIEPPEAVWEQVQGRVQSRSPLVGDDSRSGTGGWQPTIQVWLAMAAGLILAVAIGLQVVSTPPDPVAVDVNVALADARLDDLKRRSMELDVLIPRGAYPIDPGDRAFLSRIADVDQQLAAARGDEARQLWGQRVALLESLAEVRRSRAVLRPVVY